MTVPDILAAVTPVAEILAQLGVAHYIGGSVASSVHGVPRATLDVDLIGVLKVQADRLDFAYLERWANELGLAGLLARAFEEAGVALSRPR